MAQDDSGSSLLAELKDLVNQIGDSCCNPCPDTSCCTPCCPPCTFPYAEAVMTCPPPCLAPTMPEPVKRLQLPCFAPPPPPILTMEERDVMRYDNFYNNYNIDWHSDSSKCRINCERPPCTPAKQYGQTVDGKSPCCDECVPLPDECCCDQGCPTGFKPCTMKLCPPPCCHPYGVWLAEVQPCPPKCRKTDILECGAALKKKCGGK